MHGYLVTETITGAHPSEFLINYTLLEGDLLVRCEDGTFTKESPGICVSGFRLTDDQFTTLKPVTFDRYGLVYTIHDAP